MPRPKATDRIRQLIVSDVRSAILMVEILGPPLGLRPPEETR